MSQYCHINLSECVLDQKPLDSPWRTRVRNESAVHCNPGATARPGSRPQGGYSLILETRGCSATRAVVMINYGCRCFTASLSRCDLFITAAPAQCSPGMQDVPLVGITVVCTAVGSNKQEIAKHSARTVGQWVWDNKKRFVVNSPAPAEAVRLAQLKVAGGAGLVVINEANDNCGAGAPGDGTQLLGALLDTDWGVLTPRVAFGHIVDAQAVAEAVCM